MVPAPDMNIRLSRPLTPQVQLPNMTEQAMSTVAWGLCRLDVQPPRAWIQRYLEHCFKMMHTIKTVRPISFSVQRRAADRRPRRPDLTYLFSELQV